MRVHKLNNVEHAMGMLEKQKVPIIKMLFITDLFICVIFVIILTSVEFRI